LIISTDNFASAAADRLDDEADALPPVEQWSMDAAYHGRRLDQVLSQLVDGASRSHLQALIQDGAVTLDGHATVKPSTKVSAGQVLTLEWRPAVQDMPFLPERMPLDVVYEDESLLVINKPAGLVVHPAAGNWTGTLLNGLLAWDAQLQAVPRAGIVHRLDKDTSGLMVVAKTRSVMDKLVEMIAARQVHREYLALAKGRWKHPASVTCREAIGRDPKNRLRMAVVDLERQSGKQACTHLHWHAGNAEYSLVRAELETGRTHQIRVHMSHLGHPLVADSLYGGGPGLGMMRQALHARRLCFDHPVTGEFCEFRAPLPQDMAGAVTGLGWDTMVA